MSVHSTFNASPILAAVSFKNIKSVAVLLVAPAIRVSISSSVGMNGISDVVV